MRPLLCAFSLALCLSAQPAKSKRAEVDQIFAAFNTHTPGCAVGVSQNGSVALTAGYGMADLERGIPVTPHTVFESGSVAKQFTAMAALLAAQQGKISLDDPLRKYLPEIPDYGTPLTIRHVLSHISGLREWRLPATLSGIPEGSYVLGNHDLLRFASQQRALNFPPGTAYSYTNTGFNVLCIAIERALANGKSFQDFTRENIFEPLHMTHTRWRDNFRAVVPNRALAYERRADTWVQATPIENIFGAGGLLSTVGDWLLWNDNFTHAKVGGPAIVKLQQTPATLSNGKTITYAAGLTVDTYEGLREVSHGGSTGGYRTWIGRYPEKGLSVAIMCNSGQANASQLGRSVARLWTASVPAPKPTPVPLEASALAQHAGLYRSLRNNTVAVLRVRDGSLFLENTPLIPLAPAEFSAGPSRLLFQDGRLTVATPDGDVAYQRVDRAQPSASDLAPLAGKYDSPEAAITLTVAAAPGALTLAIGHNKPATLRPTFRDAFDMQTANGTASILFLRDPAGQITGLTISDGRAWNLRFTRTVTR